MTFYFYSYSISMLLNFVSSSLYHYLYYHHYFPYLLCILLSLGSLLNFYLNFGICYHCLYSLRGSLLIYSLMLVICWVMIIITRIYFYAGLLYFSSSKPDYPYQYPTIPPTTSPCLPQHPSLFPSSTPTLSYSHHQ